MKIVSKIMLLGLAICAFAGSSSAQDHTLVISSWAPPTHVVNAVMWPDLIERIETATNGAVTAEIKYNLAPPPAQADVVLDGVADLTYIFHGYNPGRFVGTQMIELPGYEGDAEAASVAYWRAYKRYLADLREHDGFELVGLFTHGPAALHTVDPIETLADIKDLKLRLGGGVGGAIGTELGAVGVQVPAPRVYETLSSRTADGVFINMDSRTGFRLTEVAPHVFEVPGGFYRGSFAVVMNADTFSRLPAGVQEALRAEVFGEPVSRAFGAAWDAGDAQARAATAATGGNSLGEASDADIALFEQAAGAVTYSVLEAVSEKGAPAAEVRAFIVEQMRRDMVQR